MDDLLHHLHKVLRSLEKAGGFKFAVLRGLTNGSWLAVYAVRAAISQPEASSVNMSKLSEVRPHASKKDSFRLYFSTPPILPVPNS